LQISVVDIQTLPKIQSSFFEHSLMLQVLLNLISAILQNFIPTRI